MNSPIVLIHGLWLTPRSREGWKVRFAQRGHEVLAPAWPGMEREVEALRRDPSVMNGLGVTEVVDHYDSIIRGLDTSPVIMGHSYTPGHSVVRLASGRDRLTFAGDAVFQVAFDRPDWLNGFEHDPEEAARVRMVLLRELAATGEALVATHLPVPSVCHVAVAGNHFRGVPAVWDY